MKIKCLLLFVILNCLLMPRSSAQIDSSIIGKKYASKLAGWAMIIPSGWEKLPDEIRNSDLKDANKKLRAPSAESSTINLLALRKNIDLKYPMFLSGLIARAYLKSGGVYTPQQYLDYQVKLLERANIAVTKTYGQKTIDGLSFISYHLNRLGSTINQKGLVCLRGKYLFYLTWIYVNDEDDQIVEKAVETSIFTKNKF